MIGSISEMNSTKRGAVILALGQAAVQASSFARNIILARLISPADFGIAALFAMTLQVIEMLTNVSAETFLVQSEDGDDPALQGTLHSFRAVRGLCSGLGILLLGGTVAKLFGAPQAGWAFSCVGALPLMRGLSHLDITRLQRHMRYAPSVKTEAGASWLATIGIAPLAFWFRDYRAMLFILLGQGFITMALSHVLAERRYSMTWSKAYWCRLIAFGWPLTVNGLLMFGIFQGDRLVVGSAPQLFPGSTLTLADLGVYSAAFALAQAPTMMLANSASSLFLPVLSRLQASPEEFRSKYRMICQSVSFAASLTAALFLTAGHAMVTLVFGSQYRPSPLVVGLIGAMWAVRIVRVAPTIAAIAAGDTKNTMIANGIRSLGIVGMCAAAALGADLAWIPFASFAAEVLALGSNVIRLKGRTPLSVGVHTSPLALGFGCMIGSALIGVRLGSQSLSMTLLASTLTIITVFIVLTIAFGELRHYSIAGIRSLATFRLGSE